MSLARRHKPGRTRGVAATECALILPIVFMLTAGTVEMCSTIFLRESVLLAAHEGARMAIRRHATTTHVTTAVNDMLALRGVDVTALTGEYLTISPDPATAAILVPITVTVTAPTNGNTVFPTPNWFTWMRDRRVSATVVMRREFND